MTIEEKVKGLWCSRNTISDWVALLTEVAAKAWDEGRASVQAEVVSPPGATLQYIDCQNPYALTPETILSEGEREEEKA